MRAVPILGLMFFALSSFSSLFAQPVLQFEEQAVLASGFSPGATTIWFSVSAEPHPASAKLVRRDRVIVDADQDGSVRFDLPVEVARASFWLVADAASGDFITGSPERSPFRELEVNKPELRPDNAGQMKKLVKRLSFAETFVMRPGEGAWRRTAGDGGATDEDRKADGRIELSVESMTPVGESPAAPKNFRNGDVIAVVDPHNMRYYVTRVGR